MFCTQCGKKIPEGTNKCPNCCKEEGGINFSDMTNYAGQRISWQLEM